MPVSLDQLPAWTERPKKAEQPLLPPETATKAEDDVMANRISEYNRKEYVEAHFDAGPDWGEKSVGHTAVQSELVDTNK